MFVIGLFLGLVVGICISLFIYKKMGLSRKINVDTFPTSAKSQGVQYLSGYGDGNYNGFGV